MNKETFFVYVTKYCLTSGIQHVEVVKTHSKDMVAEKNTRLVTYHNNDFHLDLISAKADAENRKHKKIISLQKQLSKLEKLKF